MTKLQPEEGERRHFGFRITPEKKARIEAAAKASGRSMSQEVEVRLEQSFDREDLLPDALRLAFGELGGIVLLVAVAMERSGRLTTWRATDDLDVWMGDRWLSHPTGYDAAVKAAHDVLELARPPGNVEPYEPPFGVAEMVGSYLKNTTVESPPAYSVEIRQLLSLATQKRITRNAKQASSGATAHE